MNHTIRRTVLIVLSLVAGSLVFLCPLKAGDFTEADTTTTEQPPYDPFGPANAPDHTGQGSGGVITPSPYENIVQTYFTRINADFYGLQYMLDSPLQISLGSGWTAYQTNGFGLLIKLRGSGIRQLEYDPVRKEAVPYYYTSFEASFDRPFNENRFRAFRIRMHTVTEARGLGMAGIGVVISKGNLLLAGDRPMDRKLDVELTWIQVAGGYIMPLSPNKGGVNIALGGAVDLLGGKYMSYHSDPREFIGAKIGSIGWVASVGWNANALMNLAGYIGAEWSFSTGALVLQTNKTVLAFISRTTIYFGAQATGKWVN
ncbi:MAG: hypothetical protein OEM41_08535, partial [Ignavibacteria bacterium]|nr:hypothetical protein [Ignavibacteria bacterium]